MANLRKLRLSDKLMFSTVRIRCTLRDGRTITGTGFYYSKGHVKVIVTNKHVVKNSETGELSIARGINNEPSLDSEIHIEFNNFSELWETHPDCNIDLAVMLLKLDIRKCREQNKEPFVHIQHNTIADRSQWRDLIPIEDIAMVGYPYNLWDKTNNLPFFMKGITASHPDINYNGREEFVINLPIYPGSSGSPVFLVNDEFYTKSRTFEQGRDHLKLIGIGCKHLCYTKEGKTVSEIPEDSQRIKWDVLLDLGIAIRSTKLCDFNVVFEKNPLKWEI